MSTDDRLTHMVYEASLDNTLLPELILALTEQVQIAADGRLLEAPDPQDGNSKNPSQQTMNDLVVHFRRALEISEKMVVLQEKSSDLEAVLSTLSVGVALLDEEGMPIISNRAMRDTGLALDQTTPPLLSPPDEALDGGEKPLSHWVAKTNAVERPQSLIVGRSDEQFTLLPRVEAA
ncbi:MAG: hypothetical protein OXD48_09785, partial [Litoreibacter sp.]|nr:hypothetical protein [Litoreibacter sp.]